MIVVILNTTQASKLHKRFDRWYEIQPIPVKNDKWIINVYALIGLKDFLIDSGLLDDRPAAKQKAIDMFDALKDLPRYELDDYPQYLYDQENETELAEYTARFSDLDPIEYVT